MNKVASCLLAAVLTIFAISPAETALAEGPTLDQVSDNIILDNADWGNASGCSNNPLMMFQPGITGYLESIDLPIRSYRGRVDGFNIDIMAYNEATKSVVDGTLLASQSQDVASVGDNTVDFAWTSFKIDERPQLLATKKYVIRLFAGFDGNCNAGFSWASRKWDAPDYERGAQIMFDEDTQAWKFYNSDYGFKTYMTPHEPEVDPEVQVDTKSAKPSISFFLAPGQTSLSASDKVRLSKLMSKTSKNSNAVCVAANYGFNSKSEKYSQTLAKNVCGSLKKIKPQIARALKITQSSKFGKSAAGAKWTPGSYRVDIVISKN